ncbi:MAG: Ig-like domain-containing protein [Bacteroidota bacterium]
MKKIYLLVIACIACMSGAFAQVSLTATGGTTAASYTTLGLAFAAINAGTHTGVITLSISASTTEAGPCVLNSSSAGSASYTAISIRPTADAVTVSGPTTTGRGLIELNGADNVTIDGDNAGSAGTNRNLTFTNTAANTITFTSVIRLVTGTGATSADGNTIKNCNINGSATGRNVSGTTTGAVQNTMGIYGGGGAAGATTDPAALAAVNTSGASSTLNNLVIDNNAINNCARGISINGASAAAINTLTISGNVIGSSTALTGNPPFTTPTSTVYTVGITVQGITTLNITGNTVQDIVSYSSQPIRGIEIVGTTTTATIQLNIIDGVVANGTGATGTVNGIFFTGVTGACNIISNTINNIQTLTGSAGVPAGISINNTATIRGNKISKVHNRNTGTWSSFGMNLLGGNNCVITNNFVSDVNYDISGGAAFNSTLGAAGIRLGTGTGHQVYHNTVYMFGTFLGATAGTGVGSGCIQIGGTGVTGCDIRNNIFANTMTSTSTSISAACVLFPASPTAALNLTLNNNAYYSGTQVNVSNIAHVGAIGGTRYLAANFIASATSPATNLRALTSTLSAAGTNDNSSFAFTTAPPFISTTNLHIPAATATSLESGGAAVGVTTDIDGDTRPGPTGSVNGGGTAPDLGADEFDGIPMDQTAPLLTYTPLSAATCATGDRMITGVTITDAGGIPLAGGNIPRIYFRKNSGGWVSAAGTLTSGTALSSVWSFTVSASALGGLTVSDVVSYYIIAQDNASTPNITANPGAGIAATNVNTVTTAPTTPNTFTIGGSLGGTYTVGTGGTYTTLTSAVNAYNAACLTGPVVFNLISTTYPSETFPITINGNSFASATNTLTIKPNPGVAANITGGASSAAVIKMLNATYVTVDGLNTGGSSLSITSGNTTANTAVIWLASSGAGNNNIALKNMSLTGAINSNTSNQVIVAGIDGATPANTGGANNDNITIQGNTFLKSSYAIRAIGTAATSAGGLDNWVISNNIIGPAAYSATDNMGYNGTFLENMVNVTVSGNTMRNIGLTTSTSQTVAIYLASNINGITISNNNISNITSIATTTGVNAMCGISVGNGVVNATISGNRIWAINNLATGGYGARGIIVNTANASSNIVIANNFITDIAGLGDASTTFLYAIMGIDLEGTSGGIKIYYNTVNLFGNHTGLTTATQSMGLFVATGVTGVDVRNNIFVNTYENTASTGDKAWAIYSVAASSAYTNINYNDYYVSGTPGVLGFIGGSDRTTLTAIQAGFGGNANSLNMMPLFDSPTDLHLQPVGANLPLIAGTPIAGVTTDIDGTTRSSTTPVIGAHEVVILPCSGMPVAGTVNATVATGCAPYSSTLTVSGNTEGLGIQYQWQISSDNVSYTDIGGATSFTYSPTVSATMYYRASITCTAGPLTSSTPGVQLVLNTPPAAITGGAAVCPGSTTTLASTTSGGTWTSANTAVATVNPSTGVVTAVAGGASLISYTLSTGCRATKAVQVNFAPPLTAAASPAFICSGNTSTITATSAVTNYTVFSAPYDSLNFTPIGTIVGGVTPLTSGSLDDGWYTIAMPFDFKYYGTTYSTMHLSTNGYVNFGVGSTLHGAASVPGTSNPPNGVMMTYRDLTMTGGTIVYGTTGTAPNRKFVIDISQRNLAVSPQNTGQIIFYENANQIDIMVTSVPVATNTTSLGVQNGDATVGVAAPGRNGVAYGITVPEGWSFVWPEATTYSWTPATGLSSTTIAAPVSSATTTITYTVTGTYNGCSATATAMLSVNPTPAVVVGTTIACVGGTSSLTDATAGGAWTSSTPAVATVNASGVVTAVAAGTAVISYTINSCAATVIFTVNAAPGTFGGTPTVCTGVTTTLTNAGGPGNWTSANPAVAAVGATSGIISGIAAGTATISYANGCGVTVTRTVTVNQTPGPITGSTSCVGSTNTLTTTTPGGTWTSGTPAVATIGASTGVVTGVVAGGTMITYTLGNGCVNSTRMQYVNLAPPLTAAVSPGTICAGNTSTLTATSTVTNYTVLSTPYDSLDFTPIGTVIGGVTPLTSGTLDDGWYTISMPFPFTFYGNTFSTMHLSTNGYVNFGTGSTLHTATTPVPGAGSPPNGVMMTYRDLTMTGGTIVYGTTGTAPNRKFVVDISQRNLSVSPQNTGQIIFYENVNQIDIMVTSVPVNTVTTTLGVQNATATIGATPPGRNSAAYGITVPEGWSFVWPQATAYSWSPAADLSSSTIANPVASPTVTTTYTVTGTFNGCTTDRTATLNVNPLPAAITGTDNVCVGLTTTLASATTGGTWSSSNSTVATINAATGVVMGVAAGTTNISYTLTATGCRITKIITVNALPGAITGSLNVCEAAATTLASATTGGTWMSSATSVGTIDAATGVLTGLSAGLTNITYTLPTTCIITAQASVNPLPLLTITPSTIPPVCFGNGAPVTGSATLPEFSLMNENFNAGLGGWIITNLGVDPIAIFQLKSGTTYDGNPGDGTPFVESNPDAYAGVTHSVLVSPSFSTVGYGSASLSFNQYLISLFSSDFQVAVEYSTDGGTVWTAFDNQVDNVSGSGTWAAASPERIVSLPSAAMNLPNVKLRWVYESNQGLWWALDNIAVKAALPAPTYTWAGVSGADGLGCTSCGANTITPSFVGANLYEFTATTASGCSTTTTVTVNVLPLPAAIAGTMEVCPGTATTLTDADAGGTWSSGDATVSVGGTTGIVTGVSAGTATVSYTLPTGCTITAVVTVNGLPAAIGGMLTVCPGTTTTLTNADAGGTWMSGSVANATIGSASGIVSGVAAGTSVITYTLPTGCQITANVTVNALPVPIGGSLQVCEGGFTTTLTDATPGGTWMSGDVTVASVNTTTGVVTGNVAGIAPITYTVASGCYISANVTVNSTPAPISGTMQVCIAATMSLSDVDAGGTWASATPSVATVDGTTGVVTGVSTGTVVITYTAPTTCRISTIVTVDPLPAPIAGSTELCEGLTGAVTNGSFGGTWTSSVPAVAAIDATGSINAIAPGTTMITYTLATGCMRTRELTVNFLPAAITGPVQVCQSGVISLGNTTAGGSWISSTPAVATINTSGLLSGVASGVSIITYMLSTGCIASTPVTVNTLPGAISGTLNACIGQTSTLTNSVAGGSWTSSAPSIATVSPAGIVTAVSAGAATIVYAMPTGCSRSATFVVNPLPVAIVGASQICQGGTTTMTNATGGGQWTSSAPAVAAAGLLTGTVTGIGSGTATISYALPTGCAVTTTIVVDPLPAPITGSLAVCNGLNTVLATTSTGGTWTSSSPTGAPVSTTGTVSGLATGTATISYSFATGCARSVVVTVNAGPDLHNVTGGGGYCAGGTGVHIGVDGTEGGITYQLFLGASAIGSPVAGSGAPIDFGLITDAGTYTVRASTTLGCANNMIGSATVVVNPLLVPGLTLTTGTGDTVCSGMLTFTGTPANGGSAPAYEWKVNGVIIAGATSAVYGYSPANGDLVTLKMTSSEACAVPASVVANRTLTVNPTLLPTASISATPGSSVCQGSTATFNITAMAGGTAPAYVWMKNGSAVGTGATYSYTPADGDVIYAKLASNYQCRLADTVSSNTIAMTVNPLYTPTVTVTADPGTLVQVGTSVTLTANVSGAGPSPTYQWYVGMSAIPSATNATYTSNSFANGDTISCIVMGTGGCGFPGASGVVMNVAPVSVTGPVVGISDIRLIPNPNKGEFSVKGTLAVKADQEATIEITNMLGQTVYSSKVSAHSGVVSEQVKLSNTLANGMYMLNLISGNERKVFHFVLEQ